MRFGTILRSGSVAALLVIGAAVRAELPGTEYIFPAGGQQGTVVPVRVGGYYLHEGADFFVTGPQISAEPRITRTDKIWFEGPLIVQPASQGKEDYPVDYLGRLSIEPGAPPGIRRWFVHTGQGVTPTRLFVVGRLPEIVEQETDGQPLPAPVSLPVTINGRIFPRQDIDVWTFEAAAGQTVTCAVLSARLGSPLISRLEVRGPSGTVVTEDVGSAGGDAFVQFQAPVAGRYAAHIHDADYGGLQHYVYRLQITAGPFVSSVFPLGGRPGETLTVELQGANLPAPTMPVTLPASAGDHLFWWHPEGLAAGELGIPLDLTDAPALREVEPNDAPAQAQAISLPANNAARGLNVDGRIQQSGDIDCVAIEAKQGVVVRVAIRAATLGSFLDSVLTVLGPQGQTIAQADDANGSPDAALAFAPAEDGRYVICLQDRIAERGGPEFAYRLHIAAGEEQPVAPFRLTVPVDVVNVEHGGQAAVKVDVQRFGFNEPIELICDGLPAGVTITGGSITQGANQANLLFKAEEKGAIGLHALKIIGAAQHDGAEVRSVAALPAQFGDPQRETLALSINVPTPFKVFGRFESKFSPRGSVYVRHYTVDRRGFAGPLEISLADRQNRHLQGVSGPTITVPAGETEFDYPLALAPWMELSRTSRTCIMAVGAVTLENGQTAKVAFSSQDQNDQIIVITAPERMNLELSSKSFIATAGATAPLGVELQRDGQLTNPVTLEVVCPAHLPVVTADPVTLSAAATGGQLLLKFKDGPLGPINMPVKIRATTNDERGYPVVAEAPLELVPSTSVKHR